MLLFYDSYDIASALIPFACFESLTLHKVCTYFETKFVCVTLKFLVFTR